MKTSLKTRSGIKQEIIKNRLKEILKKNPKKIARILSFLIKRSKNV